jgi:hypothetical protein
MRAVRSHASRPGDNKDRHDLFYSQAVDAWAVGVLSYELPTGRWVQLTLVAVCLVCVVADVETKCVVVGCTGSTKCVVVGCTGSTNRQQPSCGVLGQ